MYGISHVAVKQKDENMCFAEAVITRADCNDAIKPKFDIQGWDYSKNKIYINK